MKQVWKNVFMLCFAKGIDFTDFKHKVFLRTGQPLSSLIEKENKVELFSKVSDLLNVQTYQLFLGDTSMIKVYLSALFNVINGAKVTSYEYMQKPNKMILKIDDTFTMALSEKIFSIVYLDSWFNVEIPEEYRSIYDSYRRTLLEYLAGEKDAYLLFDYLEIKPEPIKESYIREISEEKFNFRNIVFDIFINKDRLLSSNELRALQRLDRISFDESVSYYSIKRICRTLRINNTDFFLILNRNRYEYKEPIEYKLYDIAISKKYNWVNLENNKYQLQYRQYRISIDVSHYIKRVSIEIGGVEARYTQKGYGLGIMKFCSQAEEYIAFKEYIGESTLNLFNNDGEERKCEGISYKGVGPSVCTSSSQLVDRLCNTDYWRINKEELLYGYLNGDYCGCEDYLYDGASFVSRYSEYKYYKDRTFRDSNEYEEIKESIICYGTVLSKVDIKNIVDFDWSTVELVIRDNNYFCNEQSNTLRELVFEIKSTENIEEVLANNFDFVNTIEVLSEKTYATRLERLNDLMELINQRKYALPRVLKDKYELLCELYYQIFDDNLSYYVKEPEVVFEKDYYTLLKELAYVYVPWASGKGIKISELYSLLKKKESYSEFEYYFNFDTYLAENAEDEIRCLVNVEKGEWDKAVILEDNATYLKYPELKKYISDSFEKIIESETSLLNIFWQDKYYNFILYCSEREWYSMRDLLKCDFRELYYSNGGDWNITKQQVNAIVLVLIEWIKGLSKKNDFNNVKEEENIDTVLNMFWS